MKLQKNIIIKVLIIIMVLMTISSYASAKTYRDLEVGDTVDISFQDLQATKFVMCIQHGASLKNGKKHYKVGKVVKIGTEYGASNPIEAFETQNPNKKIANKLNAKFAYIIYSTIYDSKFNSGYPSKGQKTIWNETEGYKQWRDNVGYEFLEDSYNPRGNEKYNEELVKKANVYADFAEEYTKIYKENGNLGIKRTTSQNLDAVQYNGKTYIGPIAYNFAKVNSQGMIIGNIKTITVDSNNISKVIVKKDNNFIEIDISKIEPKQEFYVPGVAEKTNKIEIVQNASLYSARICFLSVPGKKWQNLIWTNAKKTEISISEELKVEKKEVEFKLNLVKVNEEGERLDNAKFKIEADKENKKSEFDKEIQGNSIITFKFNNTGIYKYTITETNPPKDHKILADNIKLTIEVDEKDGKLYIKSKDIPEGSGITFNGEDTLTVVNEPEPQKEYVKITGHVWIDEPKGKSDEKNALYDEGEKIVSGVKVVLYEGKTKIDEKITDTEGKYEFEAEKDKDYVIKFEYDGVTYTTIEYLKDGKDVKNNSRAEEINRKEFNKTIDEKLQNNEIEYIETDARNKYEFAKAKAQTSDYLIEASTDETYEKDDLLKKLNKDVEVNLGLAQRQADFELIQKINNVELSNNGEIIKEQKSKIEKEIEISKDEINLYLKDRNTTREFFLPKTNNGTRIEDYVSQGNQNPADLKLEVTYLLSINNSANAKGYVKELINYYSDSYKIVSITDSTGTSFDFKDTNSKFSGYKAVHIDLSNLALPNKEGAKRKNIYVKYEVNKDKNGRFVEGEKNVVTEITKYSTYIENADDMYEKTYNSTLDINSAPNNLRDINNILTFENDTAKAQGLNIIFKENARIISGKVWDDKNNYGIYDSGEFLVNNVTVQLIEITSNGKFIFAQMQTGANEVKYMPVAGGEYVSTTLNDISKGEYKFEDIVPGNYIIRFKYGDTVEGVELQEQDDGNKYSYNGAQYEAPEYGNDSNAKDNEGRREEVKNYNNTAILSSPYAEPVNTDDLKTLAEETYMYADTEQFSFSQGEDSKVIKNLGIRKIITNKITLKSEVSNIKVTLNNGTVYLEDNPPFSNTYGTDENKWIFMSNEITNGATLDVKYKFTLENKGTDKINSVSVVDYLPVGMAVKYDNPENSDWKNISREELSNKISDNNVKEQIENSNRLFSLREITDLEDKVEFVMVASTILNTDTTRELNFKNLAEVLNFNCEKSRTNEAGQPGNSGPELVKLVGTGITNYSEEDEDVSMEITITKPTGNMQIDYGVIFMTFFVLALGCMIAKQHIKNRKH